MFKIFNYILQLLYLGCQWKELPIDKDGEGRPEIGVVQIRVTLSRRQRLWHGRWPGCRRKLAALCRWTQRKSLRDVAGIERLQRHASELLGYLERNQDALVHYAARRRCGEPISAAFVESAVNEIVARRVNKKQQMRWNRMTVQSFLDVRPAVLNDTLEDAFCHRYPGFRSAHDEHGAKAVAA